MEQNYANKEKNIKNLIFEKYNIEISKIEKTQLGTAECYFIYAKNHKYFLKIYQKKYDKIQILNEIKICQLLSKNQISVSKYISDKTGNFINDSPYGNFTLQEYISGTTYDKFQVPDKVLLQSANILGRINNILENVNFLKEDFPIDWIKGANANTDIAKLENTIHMAEKSTCNIYKNRIINDCKWKLSIMPEIEKNKTLFYQLTRKNSHGDYNTYQWICENENIKCVIDFGSCGNIPIIWELVRSFTYSSAECNNEKNINIKKYIEYLKEYLKVSTLKTEDFCYGFSFYLFTLLTSNYGYKEYMQDLKNGHMNNIINFAFWRTDMCRFLYQTATELDFKVYESLSESGV